MRFTARRRDAVSRRTGDCLRRCVPDEPHDQRHDAVTKTSTEELTLEQMATLLTVSTGCERRARAVRGHQSRTAGHHAAERVPDPGHDARRCAARHGRRARRELGRSDLSGKTGTSNDRRDAWFGGFNADLAAVVWVGYDDDLPLGPREEGSRTALPIWIEFARIALEGVPEHQMPMPEGIVSVQIDREPAARPRPVSAT